MARLRSIKPGFFKNELLAEVPPVGRLLFAGMWGIADREGRLEDRPKRIKADVMPYDDFDAEAMVAQLASLGFLLRYEVDGARYLQIVNWDKHQQPHMHEAKSTIQAPYMHGASTVPTPDKHESSTGHARLELGSLTRTKDVEIDDSKDRGVQGGADAPAPQGKRTITAVPKPKSAPKVPFPANFMLTDEMNEWALADGCATVIDIRRETGEFIEYWTEGEGAGEKRKNWLLIWKKRMRLRAEIVMSQRAKGIQGNGATNRSGIGQTARERSDDKIIQRGRELYGPGAFGGVEETDIPLLPRPRPNAT